MVLATTEVVIIILQLCFFIVEIFDTLLNTSKTRNYKMRESKVFEVKLNIFSKIPSYLAKNK
jgi:hypothetical protein